MDVSLCADARAIVCKSYHKNSLKTQRAQTCATAHILSNAKRCRLVQLTRIYAITATKKLDTRVLSRIHLTTIAVAATNHRICLGLGVGYT